MADYRAVEDGNTPQSSRVFKILTIVFGVCALGLLIGLIVVVATSGCTCHSSSHPAPASSSAAPASSSAAPASSSAAPASSSSEPPVKPLYFDQYTSEMVMVMSDNRYLHATVTTGMKYYVFNENKWALDTPYGNSSTVEHVVMNCENNDTATFCFDFVSHKNCVNLTYPSSAGTFSIEGMFLYRQRVPCHDLLPNIKNFIPQRNLTLCDYYGSTSLDADEVVQAFVESENNYPVAFNVKVINSDSVQTIMYGSFKPGKPEDESVLKPYPDVTIYDLTDNSGIDESKFKTKKYGDIDKYLEPIRRTNKFGILPHLPIRMVSGNLERIRVRNTVIRDVNDIPEQFDARQNWTECSDVIGTITNQDICGSCWAMASSSVLSDRVCIATGVKQRLSPQYMVYCGTQTRGCHGGDTVLAWQQLIDQGTVPDSCVPFTARDGTCPTKCYDGSNITEDIKVRAKDFVVPWGNTSESRVQAIQSEIMTNGPVEAIYFIFDDFLYYKSGVYHR